MSAEHCWHRGESTFTTGFDTSWNESCCWCGTVSTVTSRQRRPEPVEGHGPFHTPARFDRVRNGGDGPCFARVPLVEHSPKAGEG